MLAHNERMDRDLRTNKEWFLYNLFTDTEFARIRDDAVEKLKKVDPVGVSKLIGRGTDEYSNDIIQGAINQLVEEFQINQETATRGLFHSKHLAGWNKARTPFAYIEDERIVISIGSETRLDDVKDLWSMQVTDLQNKLNEGRKKRSKPSDDPSLTYLIHKQIAGGRRLADIYSDYTYGRLAGYDGATNLSESDFRKHYRDVVQGLIKDA